MNDQKENFIKYELWMLAWAGSVQRNKTYKENASESQKVQFRKGMREFLWYKILPKYQTILGDDEHLNNIQKIIDKANELGASYLEGHYKFGTAQKLLNLILKYYWCQGWLPEPPHCPIDGIIINKLNCNYAIQWTSPEFGSENYLCLIKEISKMAQDDKLSIAEWELKYFVRK